MSGATSAESSPRYEFPPLERRGVLLGLRGGSVATLVLGAVAALEALRSLPGTAGVGSALLLIAAAAAVACWPIAGQPTVAWLPTLVGWAHRRGAQPRLDDEPSLGIDTGRHGGGAPHPSPLPPSPPSPAASGPRPGRLVARAQPRRPGATAPRGLRLVAAPAMPGEGDLGVVEDLVTRSWAAVLPVGGPTLTLVGPDEQGRRLGAWGAALAGLARGGGAVRRLQWVEQCTPSDPLPMSRVAAAAPGPPEACRSYRQAVAAEAPACLDHRALLVVSVQTPGSLPLRRMAPEGLNDSLRRELRLIRAQLRSADLDVGVALHPAALTALLRSACDPTRPLTRPEAASSRPGGAWPAATEERWAAVRVDGCWQSSFWIAEWPQLPVGPEVLTPLLLGGCARTVAVTMAPVPTAKAVREVRAARTSSLADDALRSRAGFIETAQRRREGEGVRRREVELADGHADFRYSGYVTVTGRTEEQLEEACAEVEQAAGHAHLVLRRMYGRQAEARSWTLPLGRGLT